MSFWVNLCFYQYARPNKSITLVDINRLSEVVCLFLKKLFLSTIEHENGQ
ncbi:Uncharacterized protein AAY48_3838 [Leptospira interrogans serovar Muenchen]|nr:Uncharacterized protein AAY48_3838 [Leptospira interrogans serovar Muenchen]